MDLLRTTDFKTWSAGRNKNERDVEFIQDLCCLSFDDELNWTFYLNGDIKTGYGWRPLKGLLNSIKNLKEKRRHSRKKKRRLVIWTKNLTMLEAYIHLLLGDDTDIVRADKFVEGKHEKITMEINNDHYSFRSFDLISGEPIEEVRKTYKWENKSDIETIVAFIHMRMDQGFDNWVSLRYSLANTSLKMFYQSFSTEEADKMKNESVCRSISLKVADFYQWASKSGVIACNVEQLGELLTGVRGFDINEAYGSQFVRGNDFPLSRPYQVDSKELVSLIKEDRWFMLVMISDIEAPNMPRWFKPHIEKDKRTEEDVYFYFFENYDYKTLKLLGLSLNDFGKECGWKVYALYTCDEVGYLNYELRKQIVIKYAKRKELKKLGDPEEKMIKAQLKFLYGKGLAKRLYENGAETIREMAHYKTHYINETIAFHALARNRYEIVRMMKKLDFDYVSVDTDGIKTMSRDARRLFAERNKEIIAENKAAGFENTIIGLWKYEGYYRYFIQFANKVYAYEDGGKLVCKFAGCIEQAWRDYFKDKSIEEAFAELAFSDVKIPHGIRRKYIVIDDNAEFQIKKESYSYGINGVDQEEENECIR